MLKKAFYRGNTAFRDERHRHPGASKSRENRCQMRRSRCSLAEMSIYRRALGYYRPFLGQTIAATVVMLILIPFNLLKPWPLAFVIGEVLPAAIRGDTTQLAFAGFSVGDWSVSRIVGTACIAVVVIHIVSGWLNLMATMLYLRVGLHGLLKLRTDLYACLHSLPLKFHDARRSADSSFRVAYDSQALQTFYAKATFIFQTAITIVSTLAAMAWLDWQLTGLSLIVLPLMIATFRQFARRIRDEATIIAERESAVLTQVQEGLSSVKMVQAFGREEYEVDVFRHRARGSLEANIRLQNTSMRSALIVSTLLAISTAAICWLGARHVLDGSLQLKSLIAIIGFGGYLLMFYAPLESLTQVGWDLEKAAAGAQRCFEVLDHLDDVADSPTAKALEHARGEITFEHVRFGYSPDRDILRDVDVRIAPGQTVAFVGGTGAGKSTLLALVPRFYDPSGGRITLDGHDLRDITKKSLRSHISIVLQDTLLFSTTIRENIAYGRPDATEEEIIEAAQRAQAHEFIMATADGYRSQVGERGGHLSVGQRQRIGIARAFLKNAPILILDEPTSALDPTTESAIMTTLEELMRGRTTLIITHRIATIHAMEKIVVLGDGRVLEEGRGPELVTRGGAYAKLYRSAHPGT